MELLIKSNAGREYLSNQAEKTLVSLRGKWVTVDTSCLFNNQYNLLDYDLRVMDIDVQAIRNDVRLNMVKCGYCGKVFANMAEYQKHIQEENELANACMSDTAMCENCFYYNWQMLHDETEHNKNTEIVDGVRIDTNTTVYKWKKERTCKQCTHAEHGNYKPFVFTPENTYFLKYPNGYEAYFNGLTAENKAHEINMCYQGSSEKFTLSACTSGSYIAIMDYTHGKLSGVKFSNTRRTYTLNIDDVKEYANNHYCERYCFYKDEIKEAPKAAWECIENFMAQLHNKSSYMKQFIFNF